MRQWRERAGLTRLELARSLRVTETTVLRWETGKTQASLVVGFALNYLGAHPERMVRAGGPGAAVLKAPESEVREVDAAVRVPMRARRRAPEPPGAGVGISSAVGMRYAGGMEQRG